MRWNQCSALLITSSIFANQAGAPVPQGRLNAAQDEIQGEESKTKQPRRDGRSGKDEVLFPSTIVDGVVFPGFHPGEIISRPFGTALFCLCLPRISSWLVSVVPAGLTSAVLSGLLCFVFVYPGFHPGLLSAVPAGLRLVLLLGGIIAVHLTVSACLHTLPLR